MFNKNENERTSQNKLNLLKKMINEVSANDERLKNEILNYFLLPKFFYETCDEQIERISKSENGKTLEESEIRNKSFAIIVKKCLAQNVDDKFCFFVKLFGEIFINEIGMKTTSIKAVNICYYILMNKAVASYLKELLRDKIYQIIDEELNLSL